MMLISFCCTDEQRLQQAGYVGPEKVKAFVNMLQLAAKALLAKWCGQNARLFWLEGRNIAMEIVNQTKDGL